MKVAIGSDHAGFELKEALRERLLQDGHEIVDVGTASPSSTDYPDFAEEVAERVAAGEVERGLLVCSTGVGMSIAANKVPGVRAALAYNDEEVQLTRAHNDANVLAIGARYTNVEDAHRRTQLFFETPFEGGRHLRRVQKIAAIEKTHKEQDTKA
jgi:ribose 5-phosphate isomerase B